MAIRQAQERTARTRALEVLEENGIDTWPVVPERIAAAFPFPLPIDVSDGFPPRTYGALFKAGNDFRIVLSSSCPTGGHRRFTLSHELGHFFLAGHLEALFDGGAEVHMSDTDHFRGLRKPWYELEADAFASELLVPTPYARAVVARAAPGLSAVHAIAAEFDTSFSCAAIRYASLTNEPVAVVLSHDGVVEWACYSSQMQAHWWTRRRVKGDWAPPRSATRRLARSADAV